MQTDRQTHETGSRGSSGRYRAQGDDALNETHAHVLTQARTRTHARARARTHTHTHNTRNTHNTHTHTHTHSLSLSLSHTHTHTQESQGSAAAAGARIGGGVGGGQPSAEQLEGLRRHIVDKILTLSCPRCGQAFVDFEGCCALSCFRWGPVHVHALAHIWDTSVTVYETPL